MRDTVNKAV